MNTFTVVVHDLGRIVPFHLCKTQVIFQLSCEHFPRHGSMITFCNSADSAEVEAFTIAQHEYFIPVLSILDSRPRTILHVTRCNP